jgi:thiamine pyrophosphokinase
VDSALIFAAVHVTPTPRLKARLPLNAFVVAADHGAANALAFGLTPDVVVGDFDSIDPETQAVLDRRKVQIEAYPRDKEQTDGQLAIERALQSEAKELFLVGFLGGPRLDMTIANVLLLTRTSARATLLDELNECTLLNATDHQAWHPDPDERISIVPITPTAQLTTQGLRWPLSDETLYLGDTRGISNEPVSTEARVDVGRGSALLIRHFARV